jgi:hypothetical protein
LRPHWHSQQFEAFSHNSSKFGRLNGALSDEDAARAESVRKGVGASKVAGAGDPISEPKYSLFS